MRREAKANVPGLRQETQFTCMATSLCGALRAWGKRVTEDDVNRVMGCQAMRGASWEEALATAQYFGMRGTLVVPSTVEMLRDWTSRGVPVLIAWNPEGRPWSHASTVYDVDGDDVYVMDPNIPDPHQTTRVVPTPEFYKLWIEKVNDSLLVRRPALAIEREVTPDGRQVVASDRGADRRRIVAQHGLEAWNAWEDYAQAVTNLEASADQVVVATNKLRSLGVDPQDADYPFTDDIDVVASDIYRWRGEVDAKFNTKDSEFLSRMATRVASRHLSAKGRTK